MAFPAGTGGGVMIVELPDIGGDSVVGSSLVADQTARNPERPLSYPSDLNLTSRKFVLVMMVNGVCISDEVPISPHNFSSSISIQSYAHVL